MSRTIVPPARRAPLPAGLAAALDLARPRLGPIGSSVSYFPSIGSTNDEALRLADAGCADGALVVAGEQTAGRGRSGRAWHSPPGAGLYLSLVLRVEADRPSPGADWTRWITLAAGVALADGVRAASGLPARLKWPNDVVVAAGDPSARDAVRRARKIAGILAEAHSAGALRAIVLGMGINVGLDVYPPGLAARVSSIEAEAGRSIDPAAVLVEALAALWSMVSALRSGGAADLLDRWRTLAIGLTGAAVEFADGPSRARGVTAGVDADGALIVEGPAGARSVRAGEVVWL